MRIGTVHNNYLRPYCNCNAANTFPCSCNSSGIRQEYSLIPTKLEHVRGLSSETIFIFMNNGFDGVYGLTYKGPRVPRKIRERKKRMKFRLTYGKYTSERNYTTAPSDVDDWERNRALLLCYPEWKPLLIKMSKISNRWKILVENWNNIEEKYNLDLEKYGQNFHRIGECNTYIKSLIDGVKHDILFKTNYYKFWWNQDNAYTKRIKRDMSECIIL